MHGRFFAFFLIFAFFSPWTLAQTLRAAQSDSDKFPSPSRTITVLCLGDSLTEGYGVPKEAAWPSLIQDTLKKRGYGHVKIINAGISGSTSASGVSRLKWFLKSPEKPEIMILELGANDGLRGIDTKVTEKNLRDVIQFAKAKEIKVLLAGMQMPTNYGPDYTKSFAEVFARLAATENTPFIPFFLEGVAGQRPLNQGDGIHPNVDGYKVIAANVLKYLEPMLSPKS